MKNTNLDLNWLRDRLPIFAKMESEAKNRYEDEQRYRDKPGYVPKLKQE